MRIPSKIHPIFFTNFFNYKGIANPDAKRLYDDLLSNYNRLIRPVENNTEKLTVHLGLRLSQLIGVVSFRLLICYYINVTVKIFENVSIKHSVHSQKKVIGLFDY